MPHAVEKTQPHATKRQTVPVTLWVTPAIKAELKRLAEKEGLSVSQVGGSFLHEAIRQQLHVQAAQAGRPSTQGQRTGTGGGTMGTFALVIRRFLLFLSMVIHGIRALFASDTHLHRARFANTSELSQ